MAQSPEKIAATAAVDAAIQHLLEVQREEGDPHSMLVEWVIVTAEIEPGDTGDPEDDSTGFSVLMANGSIPWYRAEGLLRAGIRHLRLGDVHVRGTNDDDQ